MSRFVRTLGLALWFLVQLWVLRRTRWLYGKRQDQVASRLYTRQAKRFVKFAKSVGGLIIKLGQFLSVRIDLLPSEYIRVLAELQDALPAVPTPLIVDVIERELGRPLHDIYATFETTPTAAASLGQVHHATLPDGTAVAVKVLRPGIEDLVTIDLRTLRVLLRILDRLLDLGRRIDIAELEADFTATFTDELDYAKEGQHAETFQRNLLLNPRVDMPRIYWEQSTKRVLTMEYMGGVPIDDMAAIDAMGIDRHELAVNLAGLFFHMVLTDGFFHADPHPGNVFVRTGGIIELIDFGMVGSVSSSARADYGSAVLGLVRRDAPGLVRAMRRLGFLGPGADAKKLAEMIGPHIDHIVGDVTGFYTGGSMIDSMMSGNIHLSVDSDTLYRLQEFIYTQPIVLPGNTTFLFKALITVIGLCLRLDPDLDLLATAAPYVTGGAGGMELVSEILAKGKEAGQEVLPTVMRLWRTLKQVDDGVMESDMSILVERRIREAEKRQTRKLVRVIVVSAGVVTLVSRWRQRR